VGRSRRASRVLYVFLIGALTGAPVRAADPEPGKPDPGAKPEVRTVTKVSAKTGPGEGDRLDVLLDFNDAPDAKAWALDAAEYAIEWYPKLCALLASDGFEPPKEFTLHFKPMDGVAYTSDRTITISAKWIADHPDDLGMVAHELVHVIQRYRGEGEHAPPGWLTEGIADYVRYYVVEPDSKRKDFDAGRIDYTAGYQPAAGLLDWIEKERPGAVVKLNALLREGKYTAGAFRDIAGGDPDALWRTFKASRDVP
jgi:hypothetical protein